LLKRSVAPFEAAPCSSPIANEAIQRRVSYLNGRRDDLGGRYVELGLRQQGVTINPSSLDPTPEHLHFLHAFVRVLLEGDDDYRINDMEDREIYEAVENLYVLDGSQRRGTTCGW
jgi:hypothetical protein